MSESMGLFSSLVKGIFKGNNKEKQQSGEMERLEVVVCMLLHLSFDVPNASYG